VGSNRYGRQDPAPASFVNVSALLTAAENGDRAAWNALVDRFTPLIWATVRAHRLGDADAADVVQTTWLRLVEHLGRIQAPERVGAWLATTARRESLRVIAAGGRVSPTDELGEAPDQASGPAELLERKDRDASLHAALGKLGDRCRTLLRLLATEPAPSYDDVSLILGMPVGSIGPTRGRCLAQLRTELHALGISGAV
jgi:RNA polymerase sigma factor (sigma-70 family)